MKWKGQKSPKPYYTAVAGNRRNTIRIFLTWQGQNQPKMLGDLSGNGCQCFILRIIGNNDGSRRQRRWPSGWLWPSEGAESWAGRTGNCEQGNCCCIFLLHRDSANSEDSHCGNTEMSFSLPRAPAKLWACSLTPVLKGGNWIFFFLKLQLGNETSFPVRFILRVRKHLRADVSELLRFILNRCWYCWRDVVRLRASNPQADHSRHGGASHGLVRINWNQ